MGERKIELARIKRRCLCGVSIRIEAPESIVRRIRRLWPIWHRGDGHGPLSLETAGAARASRKARAAL
jgi:hypothetical protein